MFAHALMHIPVLVAGADTTGELTKWKDFMSDRPGWAAAVVLGFVCAYLFRLYRQEVKAHNKTLRQVAPVAEKLCDMLSRVGALQRKYRTGGPGRVGPDDGGSP